MELNRKIFLFEKKFENFRKIGSFTKFHNCESGFCGVEVDIPKHIHRRPFTSFIGPCQSFQLPYGHIPLLVWKFRGKFMTYWLAVLNLPTIVFQKNLIWGIVIWIHWNHDRVQVKAYLHSERFRLKFCRNIVINTTHNTWVLAVLLFSAEFQMEPQPPNAIYYCTGWKAV